MKVAVTQNNICIAKADPVKFRLYKLFGYVEIINGEQRSIWNPETNCIKPITLEDGLANHATLFIHTILSHNNTPANQQVLIYIESWINAAKMFFDDYLFLNDDYEPLYVGLDDYNEYITDIFDAMANKLEMQVATGNIAKTYNLSGVYETCMRTIVDCKRTFKALKAAGTSIDYILRMHDENEEANATLEGDE